MIKNIFFTCCLTLFLFITISMCFSFGVIGSKGEEALKKHSEFISIEKKWSEKIGEHYLIQLTGNRILEFAQIYANSGGGKYACLKRIGEFEISEDVRYINEEGELFWGDWKDSYGSFMRFRDLSNETGLKIETMTDVIDNYDEILSFVKMIANEQYIFDEYVYHADSGSRKASIWVNSIHGYSHGLWHGIKDGEIPFNADWGEEWCIFYYGENWREKLNADLPKIRKSLGLE